jgi:GT2 family glycosyltransferase
MAGSFMCVEASAFRELGGFSRELFAAEEVEFSQRLMRLGRRRRQRIVILSRHPLLTSGRKLKLYSARETLGFFLKATLRPRKMLTDRNACALWYDGRR